MTPQILLTLVILGITIALFITEWFSTDTVSLLAMLVLILTGLLTPTEAFNSLTNPVVISIGSIFVVSAALFQTGVASKMGQLIIRLAGDSEPRLIASLMIGAALLSSVMNNVAVTAVLMPAVMGIALNTERAPSRLLLPMAYAATMGGTLTLIGSPPNMIVSQTLSDAGIHPFTFLEITPLGIASVLIAILFLTTLGRKLLPNQPLKNQLRRARLPEQLINLYRLSERLFSLQVPAHAPVVGQTLSESELGRNHGLTVLGILRPSGNKMAPTPMEQIMAGDRLLIQGGAQRIEQAAKNLELEGSQASMQEVDLLAGDIGVAEVTLTPRSSLVGQTLRELDFRGRFGLTVLALWRGGEPIELNLANEPLRLGDAFLVQGPWRRIRQLHQQPGLLLISENENIPRRTRKAPWALTILVAMVAAVVTKVLPLPVAALGAAVLTILSGCLRIEDARDAVEWRVVFLIAGMLAIGTAMQKTGTTQWIAVTLLKPVANLGPLALTTTFLLLTGLLTLGISNHAAAALMAPIAYSAAVEQGLNPRPELMAVAVGTTIALFTPFAHPGFLLVMGPGGYKFKDYLRIGLPLSLLISIASLIGLTLWCQV